MFDKKILCIGNNSQDTADRVSQLAKDNNTIDHGLIDTDGYIASAAGYYQTTVADLTSGVIVNLAKQFDQVQLLDQPYNEWSHWKILLSSYKLMQVLDNSGVNVVYKDNQNIKSYLEFDDLLTNNKSFCIYPWIAKVELNGKLHPCARSELEVTTVDKLSDWKSDPAFLKLRNDMLAGKPLPDVCQVCYTHDKLGIESYRTFESREWISKLNIKTVEELNSISQPYYYELRLNNKCNIACRGCRPEHSSRIEHEYKKFNIIYPILPNWENTKQSWEYSSIESIDISTLNPNTRVYLTGGEPTVMKDVYQFMEDCIDANKTDFDFTIGTNAAVLSKKFLALTDKFSNMNFSVSLDGYGIINDYWRWGSKWDQVIANTRELQDRGHTISINCVPGIYNVTNLHLLFEFLDREFPTAGLYLQINYYQLHSAFNHPDAAKVIESMERCRQTRVYHVDGKSVRSTVEALHKHYSNNPVVDLKSLRDFFTYNDQQDAARNVKLIDYIPELDACRRYLGINSCN